MNLTSIIVIIMLIHLCSYYLIQGQELGLLNFEIVPCNKKGKEYTEKDDVWVDSPEELVGKDVHFLVKVLGARGLPNRFTVCMLANQSIIF